MRRCVLTLLCVLVVLLAVLPVLVSGYLLGRLGEDDLLPRVFAGLMVADLVLLATNVLLLVCATAVSQFPGDEEPAESIDE